MKVNKFAEAIAIGALAGVLDPFDPKYSSMERDEMVYWKSKEGAFKDQPNDNKWRSPEALAIRKTRRKKRKTRKKKKGY